jgi:hypothetical protein
MKTISKDGEILRVDNETADVKVKGGWSFIPKSEWKEKVRKHKKADKAQEVEKTTEKKKEKKW